MTQHVQPGNAGHVQIDNDGIEVAVAQHVQYFLAVLDRDDAMTRFAEQAFQHHAVGGMVVRDQDAHGAHAGAMPQERIAERDHIRVRCRSRTVRP